MKQLLSTVRIRPDQGYVTCTFISGMCVLNVQQVMINEDDDSLNCVSPTKKKYLVPVHVHAINVSCIPFI